MKRMLIVLLSVAAMLLPTVVSASDSDKGVTRKELRAARAKLRSEAEENRPIFEARNYFLSLYQNLINAQSEYLVKATPELLTRVFDCYRAIFIFMGDEDPVAAVDEKVKSAKAKNKLVTYARAGVDRSEAHHQFNISGLHADYGYLMLREGADSMRNEGFRHMRLEMELYPESRQIVETVLKSLEQ